MLKIRDLHTRFLTRQGIVHAVDGVSFDVGQGELVGVVGESGSGKTVTINTVLGLIRSPKTVSSGSVEFNGTDLLSLKPSDLRRIRGVEIGFIAQNPFGALNPILRIATQFENVIRAHKRIDRKTVRLRALSLLNEVGIKNPPQVLDGYAHELSGGMAQRVVIALALSLDPSLVIADEPTTALDLTVQKQILDLITTLVRSSGRSMLIVTHDLGVVAQYCDRVVIMYSGRVMEDGPVAQVFREPQNPYTAGLLQSVPRRGHELRIIDGRVSSPLTRRDQCMFRDRCPNAEIKCETIAPVLRKTSQDRSVACHINI